MKNFLSIASFALLSFVGGSLCASEFQLQLAPDREEALYPANHTVNFIAKVTGPDTPAGNVTFKLTKDAGKLLETRSVPLVNGIAQMPFFVASPSFIHCAAEWQATDTDEVLTAEAAAGFAPEKITQGMPEPEDFMAFWEEGKKLAASTALSTIIKEAPEFSTETLRAFRVSFAVYDGSRLYGFLAVPKDASRKYPALLTVPGAGPGVLNPVSAFHENFITLYLNVHTFEPGPKEDDWDQVIENYGERDYFWLEPRDREKNFYRRAWLGLNRSVDFLLQHPLFDGKNLGVYGNSQGGAATLAIAALNDRVTCAMANEPALGDHGAVYQDRTPGWPFFAHKFPGEKEVLDTVAYIDSANFARYVKCPITILVGFLDSACRPSVVYSIYNNIPGEKKIINMPKKPHNWHPETTVALQEMLDFLQSASQNSLGQ